VRWWPTDAIASVAATIAAKLFGSVRLEHLLHAYHPERHYMRGPGPKTLEKIGGELRARVNETTKEPIPEEWLTLLRSLEAREGKSHDHGPARRSANTRS
jgi:hypothetical protein